MPERAKVERRDVAKAPPATTSGSRAQRKPRPPPARRSAVARYEFRVGGNLSPVLARAAKRASGDRALSATQVRNLRSVARARGGLGATDEMFLAGLLDADNVRTLSRMPIADGASLEFSLDSIRTGMARGKRRRPTPIPVARERASARTVARTPAKDMIDAHTRLFNLDEHALGEDLLARARKGDAAFVQRVLDALGSTDRDDVSVEFMEAATQSDLSGLSNDEAGRALLGRLFDELTSGSIGDDEQRQADRIIAAKAKRLTPAKVEAAIPHAKIFPFRLPGMTVFNAAPITARRVPGGKVWVKQPVYVLGTDEFRPDTVTLPAAVFAPGLELPEDEVIGVRMYDLGGEVHYRPALYLVQLANTTTTKVLSSIGETAMLGLTLGSGALVGEGATITARLLLAADRVAFAVSTISSIIRDHRGWILKRFGPPGRTFLHYVDIVDSVVAVYGGVRALAGMAQLVRSLAKSISEWRAAAAAVKGELNPEQQNVLQLVDKHADDVLNEVKVVSEEETAAATEAKPDATPTAKPDAEPAAAPDTSETTSTGEGEGQAGPKPEEEAATKAGGDDVLDEARPEGAKTPSQDKLVELRVRRRALADEMERLKGDINKAERELRQQELKRAAEARKHAGKTKFAQDDAIEAADERIGKMRDRQDDLKREMDDLKTEADKLTGRPGGEAQWDSFGYGDLGKRAPCFPAGTLVLTLAGPRAIEALRPGDRVLAGGESGEPVDARVTILSESWTRKLVDVEIAGETVTATPNHPFWVAGARGFVPAGELAPGDVLQSGFGAVPSVDSVRRRTSVVTTYSLEVTPGHTFFVGRTGVLVHNGVESIFASTEKVLTRIYAVMNLETGKVMYIGKTFQGEAGDVLTRLRGHINVKPEWKLLDQKGMLDVQMVAEGEWTAFETACWEQHWINTKGGLRKLNPASPLENKVLAIDADSFRRFRQGFGHNPCAT